MNLIYPAHAKNQVRFEEKREKNVSARPAGTNLAAHPRKMRSGQGASSLRVGGRHEAGC